MAAVFSFVSHLVDVPPAPDGPRDGVDALLALAGREDGPALLLSALLQAAGERASVGWTEPRAAGARGAAAAPVFAFVRVALEFDDLRRVPPHAGVLVEHGRCYLPLRPRHARSVGEVTNSSHG